MRQLQRAGGLLNHFGTVEAREVEKMIAEGNKYAELVYQAMALNLSKDIGRIAPVVDGKVDVIILTGGVAHSKLFTGWVAERVKFIAPVVLMPGENEMESLAMGTYRVLGGQEKAKIFVEGELTYDIPEEYRAYM